MRQSAGGPVQGGPKHGQRFSLAEMQAHVDALKAELKAAREREAATAEVLQVINASPGDLVPVFDAVLDRALRLCEAPLGVLFRCDGAAMHFAAMRGDMLDEVATEWFRVWVPEPDSAVGQILKGAPFLHVEDVRDTEAYRSGVPSRVKMIDATGARTAMWVALRRDDRLLGVIVIYRREVRPFADSEIALVRSFADQAVIAMENARLLTETREALGAADRDRRGAAASSIRRPVTSRRCSTRCWRGRYGSARRIPGTCSASRTAPSSGWRAAAYRRISTNCSRPIRPCR